MYMGLYWASFMPCSVEKITAAVLSINHVLCLFRKTFVDYFHSFALLYF